VLMVVVINQFLSLRLFFTYDIFAAVESISMILYSNPI
jgi:hypothetical protein